MSHRARSTHRAHAYREIQVGYSERRDEPVMGYSFPESEFAVTDVRLTDAGGNYSMAVSGEIDTEQPIITDESRTLLDAGIEEGHRIALEGDGFAFDADAPDDGAWFEVESADLLFARGRSARGVEIRLTEV